MKKLPVTLVLLLLMTLANAQITTGALCSGAATFVPTFTAQTITQTNASGWLKFTAAAGNTVLKIRNMVTGVNAGRITRVNVYSGNCTTPAMVFSDTADAGNDSTLYIGLFGVSVSQDYYIETIKENFTAQCDNIVECNNNAVFRVLQVEPQATGCKLFTSFQATNGNCEVVVEAVRNSDPSNVCDYGEIPRCYTTLTHSLNIWAGVLSNNGYGPYQSYEIKVYTTGSPSFYTLSVVGGTTNVPLLASGSGVVSYTILCYPPGQWPNGEACPPVLITTYPGADPSFTASTFCAGQICFTEAYNANVFYRNWAIMNGINTYTSGAANPCFTLTPGTYTVTHKLSTANMVGDYPVNCGACTQSVITISPPFTLTTSVSNPESCYGTTNTLGASAGGPATYTWYPGLQNTASITIVPPPGFTQYTVVAQSGACTQTALVGVTSTVALPSFTATFNPDFVCLPNNSTTFTLSGVVGTSTLYTPAGTPTVLTNTLVLNPEVSTTYTIASYTNMGCLTHSVVKVGVVPCACITATGTEIQGEIISTSYTSNTVLKAVNDVTITNLFMSPSAPNTGLIGNEIIAYPGVKITLGTIAGGTVFLRGVYAHGCGEMWEGFVAPYKYTQYDLEASPTTPTLTTLIEDAKIGISLLNDGPAVPPSFPNQFPPTVYLNANNVTFNKNLTAIKIVNYKTNQATYPYRIENCLFTSRSITATPNLAPTFTYNTPSWPSTSTIKNSASGNVSALKTPYIDDTAYPPAPITTTLYNFNGYPQCGLRLDDVGYTTVSPHNYYGISIGKTGTDDFNCFDHLREDITLVNTNLTVLNTVFQNGERYGGNNARGGKAIYGFSYDDRYNNVLNLNAVRVTGTGTGAFGCRFYEKTYALDLDNYYDVLVQNSNLYSYANDFSNAGHPNALGGRGINIKTNRYYYLTLQKNNFYNIRSAMLIGLDNAVVTINPQLTLNIREIGTIDVNNNSVNRYLGSIPLGFNPFVNMGLQINDPLAAPNLTYTYGSINASAMSNTFTGVDNGIFFNSLSNTPVSALNNSVSMINAPGGGRQIGIDGVNLLRQASYHANIVSGPSSYSSTITGLNTAYNASLSVRCNTTSNAGRGIQFNGMEPTDFFEDNTMDNEDQGLVMDNGAALSYIGMPIGTINRPTNNQWLNSWSLPKYKAYTGFVTNAQQSSLYIQYMISNLDPSNSSTTSIGNPTSCPTAYQYTFCFPPPGSSLWQSNTVSPTCRLGGGGIGGGIPAGRMLLQQAVRDSIHYETADSTAFRNVNKTFAYRVLQGNPALMDTSVVLQNFYAASYTTNAQAMLNIEEQIANAGMSVAGALLSSFTPANAMESNYKSFYTVLMATKDSTYDATDSTSLDNLCRMCPFTDGLVVYQARALYSILYSDYFAFEDNCYGGAGARASQTPANHNADIRVMLKTTLFPNPNNGSFVVQMNTAEVQSIEIRITDITGKEVLKQNRQVTGSCELNLENVVENGLYFVKIKLEDGTHEAHRLVISK